MEKDGQDQSLQGKKQRGLVKKWSKKSLQGNVISRTQHIQCLKLGVSVNPFLLYGNLPLRPGKCIELPGCLPASQLRDLMFRAMMSEPDDFSLISRKGDRSSPRLHVANVASLRGIVVMFFSGLPISLNHDASAAKSHLKIYKDDGEESVGGCDDIILNALSPSFIEKFQYRTKLRISGGKRISSVIDELLYCTKGDMMVQRRRHRPKKRARKDNKTEEEANEGFEQFAHHRTSDGFPDIQHYIMSPKDLLNHDYPFATESYLSSLAPPAPDSAFMDYRGRLLRNSSLPMQLPSLEEACRFISECIPEVPGLEGYVCTLPPPLPSSPHLQEKRDLNTLKVFALDCEMCEVEGGRSELIRISLVNGDSQEVIIDTLVVPSEPVTDYRTQWSGVTADMLVGVPTQLCQVQAALLQAICDKDILVGHSMENDFKALRLCHRRCVDTSLLYPHPQTGRKSSLRHLAKLYLKRDIQSDKEGHCSVQDSLATLDLALLKVCNGPEFGAEGERISLLEKFTENGKRCTFAGEAATCAAHGTAGSTSTIVLRGKRGDAARLTQKECLMGGALASSTHQFTTATAAALDNDDIKINSHRPPNPPGVLWLQMPIKYSSSPSLQELARSDLTKLCKGKLPHYMKDVEIEASLVLDALPNDVLVVVALQHEERLPKEMLKWKKRCLSGGRGGMMASTWSNTQDELLRHFLNVIQIGYALLSVSR